MARDLMGVKPLYFAEQREFIAFASEAKALFFLGIKAEIDPVAIDDALTVKQTVLAGSHQPRTSLEFWRVLSDTIVERLRAVALDETLTRKRFHDV